VPEQVEPDKLQPYGDKAAQLELANPLYILQLIPDDPPAPLTVPLQVREPDDEEPPEQPALKASWAAKYTDSKRPMDTTIRRAARIFMIIPAMKLCLGPQHWARTVTEATIKRMPPTKPG